MWWFKKTGLFTVHRLVASQQSFLLPETSCTSVLVRVITKENEGESCFSFHINKVGCNNEIVIYENLSV